VTFWRLFIDKAKRQSNRAYILTHGVSGVDWKHYKHLLPEHVYNVYMSYWGNIAMGVRFAQL
jgi:hypothetical protein